MHWLVAWYWAKLIIQQIVIPTNDQFVLIQLDTSQVAGLPLNLHAYLVPGSLQTLPDLGLPLGTRSTDMALYVLIK